VRRQRRHSAVAAAWGGGDGGGRRRRKRWRRWGIFCTVFVAFHGCFDTILTVKWCHFGDKTGNIFVAKWSCFEYCLAVVFGASCLD